MNGSRVGLQNRDLLAQCIKFNYQTPLLLNHVGSPGFVLVSGLENFSLFDGFKLLFLDSLLGLERREVQSFERRLGARTWLIER